MKKILLTLILSFLSLSVYSQEIMKLADVKIGMEGTGKTIFKGTKIESFTFKVLGILEDTFGPDKDVIWVELISPELEGSGVLEGMSGSPLYIDGKLIGAVAYGFNFAKKPIAGVSPIEDMLKTSDYNTPSYSVDISNIEIKFDKENIEKISNLIQNELIKRANFSPLKEMTPIGLIPSHRGLNPSALPRFKPIIGQASNFKSSKKLKYAKPEKDFLKINPADAVAIPLIRGDFEMSFSGTVTHVVGNKVYIFGHPLFNLGSIDFPLHKAEVISVFPSYESSFKMTSTRHMIGTAVQDRFSAVQAELGRAPYMIPMKVFLKNRNRKFEMELINHSLLTPALTYMALKNLFSAEYQDIGFASISVKGKIFIENEANIIVDDLFSGATAYDELGGLVMAINFFLMSNKDKNVKIQKMDFEISGTETIRKTIIENVILEKNTFNPGELINITVQLRNERGNKVTEKVSFEAPGLSPGSIFYLMVGDKEAISKFEAKNIKSQYFPIELNLLIKAINNLRKNNRIYFKLMTKTQGLYVQGYEYSNLPLSLQNVFLFNSTSDLQSKIKYSTIAELQLPIPAVVTGNKLFKLKIKER